MMTNDNQKIPPLADPGTQRDGASTGGVLRNADAGLADSLQRSSERGDDDATGRATTGEGVAAGAEPRLDLGGKAEPGSAAGGDAPATGAAAEAGPRAQERGAATGAAQHRPGGAAAAAGPAQASAKPAAAGDAATAADAAADQPATTDADRDEPADESAIESLGRAVSEVVIGAVDPKNGGAESKNPKR